MKKSIGWRDGYLGIAPRNRQAKYLADWDAGHETYWGNEEVAQKVGDMLDGCSEHLALKTIKNILFHLSPEKRKQILPKIKEAIVELDEALAESMERREV